VFACGAPLFERGGGVDNNDDFGNSGGANQTTLPEPPLMIPYGAIRPFVQYLVPTWCKTQHENFAQVIAALLKRGTLNKSDLARAMPSPGQPLHGRLKRLERFLHNPRLDEAALCVRWLRLAYRFGDDPPQEESDRPLVPLLFDTVYFEPFALLVATIPCGSRGLPVALTTYHRQTLQACFPPQETWPSEADQINPPRRRKGVRSFPASAVVSDFLSQNQIEEHLIAYLFHLLSPALQGVIVADRGFARASLFRTLKAHERAFVIRFDAQTHIRLPDPQAPNLPVAGLPKDVLGIAVGQRVFCPVAYYGKEEQEPISLLAVWEEGQEEPWYLASSFAEATPIETLYRWRMRLECANRDEKTGVILTKGGDQHALSNLLHLHRLLLALSAAEWLCALVGLQAWQDFTDHPTLATATPPPEEALSLPNDGPGIPPPIVPHRGPRLPLPSWMKRFAARGPLSYVRLGWEVLDADDLIVIPQRFLAWFTGYLSSWLPLWRPWQLRHRQSRWAFDSS
jgi:hypothetical protein